MRDGLLAYRERMKDRAADEYFRATLLWAILAPHQKRPGDAPKLPAILRDRS